MPDVYDLVPIHAPRAAGMVLEMLVRAVELAGPSSPLTGALLASAGIPNLRARPADDEPISPPLPIETRMEPPNEEAFLVEAVGAPRRPETDTFRFDSIVDYARAYREGLTTPVAVAERAVAALEALDGTAPPMRTFAAWKAELILAQARESARRWEKRSPRGPLDGVPVAVKDELDVEGLPTTVGTRFLGKEPARADAAVVARLRAWGGVILGKTHMHEIGIGVTGFNPALGPARNPYDPARATGGSSSGSAAAVAAGLCPVALGVDGGGSIRIPASFCGVVGLKSTAGRFPSAGEYPLDWSLATMGPLTPTVGDAAIASLCMAAAPWESVPPPPQGTSLAALLQRDLAGIRVGLFNPWFEDAEPEVVRVVRAGVDALREAGAEIVPIEIPELRLLSVVHLVTIVSEMATSQLHLLEKHRTEYALETRLNLALAHGLSARDYLHAQRHRARLGRVWGSILNGVHAVVTPTTGVTAPPWAADAVARGESNIPLTTAIMRFAQAANVFGLPALSVPAGYDGQGLPVGLQLVGRPWDEARLLQLGAVVEARVERRCPRVFHRLLSTPGTARP